MRRLHDRLSAAPACLGLAALPTPVERAPWLDDRDAEVWIKRDDATSEVYGGSKVRKLEWLLANPPYDGPSPILSIGALGSHHLVATGLFLSRLGRRLHAVVFDQVPTEHARRHLAVLASIETDFWAVRTRLGVPWALLSYHVWARPSSPGRYLTPGASTPLGCFGAVEAGLELAGQIAQGELPRPSRIYVAAGTAGTGAGLALGLGLAGVSTGLRLVSAVEPIAFNRAWFLAKLHAIHRRLQGGGLIGHERTGAAELLARAGVGWTIDHGQVGPGYAVPTPAADAAVSIAAGHGLSLEPTYTGKCLAALRADLAEGHAEGPVLFWNTHAATDLAPRILPGWRDRLPRALERRLSRVEPALSSARAGA